MAMLRDRNVGWGGFWLAFCTAPTALCFSLTFPSACPFSAPSALRANRGRAYGAWILLDSAPLSSTEVNGDLSPAAKIVLRGRGRLRSTSLFFAAEGGYGPPVCSSRPRAPAVHQFVLRSRGRLRSTSLFFAAEGACGPPVCSSQPRAAAVHQFERDIVLFRY